MNSVEITGFDERNFKNSSAALKKSIEIGEMTKLHHKIIKSPNSNSISVIYQKHSNRVLLSLKEVFFENCDEKSYFKFYLKNSETKIEDIIFAKDSKQEIDAFFVKEILKAAGYIFKVHKDYESLSSREKLLAVLKAVTNFEKDTVTFINKNNVLWILK